MKQKLTVNYRPGGIDVYPADGMNVDDFDDAFKKIETEMIDYLISESKSEFEVSKE